MDDADADPTNEIQDILLNATTNELTITGGSTVTLPTSGGVPQDLLFNDTDNLIGLTGSTSTIDLSGFKTPWTEIYTLSFPPQLVEYSALDTQIGGEGGISVSNLNGQTAALFEGGQTAVHGKVELTESSDNNLLGIKGEVIGSFDDQMRSATAVEGKVTILNVGEANGFYGSVTGGERGYGIQAGASESQHAVGGRFTANGRESTRGLEINASGGNDNLIGIDMVVNGSASPVGAYYKVTGDNAVGIRGEYDGTSLVVGNANYMKGQGTVMGYQSWIDAETKFESDGLVGYFAQVNGLNLVEKSKASGGIFNVFSLDGETNGLTLDVIGNRTKGIILNTESLDESIGRGLELHMEGSGSSLIGIETYIDIGNSINPPRRSVGAYFESGDAINESYGIISYGQSIATQSSIVGDSNYRAKAITTNSEILGNNDFHAASFNSSTGSTRAEYDFGVIAVNKTNNTDRFSVGVAGFAESTGSLYNYGLWGAVPGQTQGVNYGVYGSNPVTTGANFAGLFRGRVRVEGDLQVTGNLSKSGGTFKIDHPQDPANKYLVHSFVESPDMMNIYNGNTKTDVSGKSTVELPDYFESLNIEFRYQLTVIGEFAQAIVSQKVDGNTFEIMTDKPNVEVSWQVTGVRNDPWAQKNRVVDVVDKKADRGTYLNPELYGQPQSKAFLQIDRMPSKSLKSKNSISLEESLEKIREQHKK